MSKEVMSKKFLISCVALALLGLANGQATGQTGGGVNSNGANAGGSVEVGGNSVSAEGNVNFNSSIRQVTLVLDSVWGTDSDRDMGAYTVNEATKDYDVVVKQELNAYYTATFLTFLYKVRGDQLENYVSGKDNFDDSSASANADTLYGARICDLIPSDRDKSFAPDYFFPSEIMHMIFVGRDNCQFQNYSSMVERAKTLTVNVDNSPDFELPDDPVWYLLVTILHYAGIDTPIQSAIIRAGFRVAMVKT